MLLNIAVVLMAVGMVLESVQLFSLTRQLDSLYERYRKMYEYYLKLHKWLLETVNLLHNDEVAVIDRFDKIERSLSMLSQQEGIGKKLSESTSSSDD